ncbi:MAG TPA: acetyl-CoA carboxylase biotin carboxyl carrier protein [Spirochaetia bacterium]|nr:acetyl-CoA carboxylase biotin carboxyl carrier protein [Spirochaetia bacterium]
METSDIFELLEKFDKSTLSEVIISKGDVRVTLRKPTAMAEISHVHHLTATAGQQAASVVERIAASASAEEAIATAESGEIITSPIVGTFYRAPSPDSPPFVEAGQKVEKGGTLCVLEAMKVMNELEAEFECVVLDVLVENGTMVEFGTPLFKVKR